AVQVDQVCKVACADQCQLVGAGDVQVFDPSGITQEVQVYVTGNLQIQRFNPAAINVDEQIGSVFFRADIGGRDVLLLNGAHRGIVINAGNGLATDIGQSNGRRLAVVVEVD